MASGKWNAGKEGTGQLTERRLPSGMKGAVPEVWGNRLLGRLPVRGRYVGCG